MRRNEILVTAIVVGLAGWGVASQLVPAAESRGKAWPGDVLQVGEALDPDIHLYDVEGSRRRLGDLLGDRATVVYAWSTGCPCVRILDPHLAELHARWGPAEGVRWWAVAGEPGDSQTLVEEALEEHARVYGVLLDPAHRLCGPLGLDRSSLVTVLDADGYLRYRGSPVNALRAPDAFHLADVLGPIAGGETPEPGEREPAFGCPFADPLADCPDDEGRP